MNELRIPATYIENDTGRYLYLSCLKEFQTQNLGVFYPKMYMNLSAWEEKETNFAQSREPFRSF